MDLNWFSRTLGISLDGYLVKYGGWYHSLATYLLKNHGFSWFQVIFPSEMTYLSPLRQQKVLLVTLDCFSWTEGINLDGYLVNFGGLNNSVVIYLMKTHDFCLFQANLPPRMAFLLTFGHNEIGQMAEFDRQRTHDTTRNIFLPKIRDIGGLFGQELQKLSFSLCFPYISYSKIPQNT